MNVSMNNWLDEAYGVWTRDVTEADTLVAVWHGGHTVNCYSLHEDADGMQVTPCDTRSTGDYETGETTREDAAEAAMDMLTHQGDY